MAHLVELRDVYKIYGEGLESEVRALDGVSLTVEPGEFLAIVGQSGSGKSTMMNVLGCLDIPTRGDYLLEGTDVRELTDKELSLIRNKEIGFIFQQYNLIQSLTVLENVELPLIYQGINADDRYDLAMEGSTIILITHDNGIAATARRCVRLQDGKIVEDREQEVDWL